MMTDLRSPAARVRGLGCAREGVSHWWAQRVTAVALVPLSLWFVWGVVTHIHQPAGVVSAWMGQLHVAVPMILFLLAVFWHAALGLQVVIEDYVHCACARTASLVFVKLACITLAVTGVVSVLKILFQS
jgi:succinate dehydrogenase / fumarate reductase membrane anchor subunit